MDDSQLQEAADRAFSLLRSQEELLAHHHEDAEALHCDHHDGHETELLASQLPLEESETVQGEPGEERHREHSTHRALELSSSAVPLSTLNLVLPSPVRRGRAGQPARMWTGEEDEKLRWAVKKYQEKNWKAVAEHLPGRSHIQCMSRWKNVLSVDVDRGPWTAEEDKELIDLVSKNGPKWAKVAKLLSSNRDSKRCRERYLNHLDPTIRRGDWRQEEDRVLLEARQELGNKWSTIAQRLPGRSVTDVTNRWYALARKEFLGHITRVMGAESDLLPHPQANKRPRVNEEGFDAQGRKLHKWSKEESEKLRQSVRKYGPYGWKIIARQIPGRTAVQCQQHWNQVLKPGVAKGKGSWTPEEDALLVQKVQELGRKWAKIAQELPGRIGKQCRERYINHLDPSIKREPWTMEEENILIEAHQRLWNKWSEIAKLLPGRSYNDVKNHWLSSLQRRVQSGELTVSLTAVETDMELHGGEQSS